MEWNMSDEVWVDDSSGSKEMFGNVLSVGGNFFSTLFAMCACTYVYIYIYINEK